MGAIAGMARSYRETPMPGFQVGAGNTGHGPPAPRANEKGPPMGWPFLHDAPALTARAAPPPWPAGWA
jgi:hypothetical protein